MSESRCAEGECIAGEIAYKPIKAKDWLKEANAFQKVIVDFNERTKRFAIPHPGFCWPANFCGTCGHPMADFHAANTYERL